MNEPFGLWQTGRVLFVFFGLNIVMFGLPGHTMMTLTVSQAWAVLSVAILLEVAGTTSMRLSEGFTRLTPSVLIFVFYAASFGLNTLVIRVLGLSVVYGVWSGVGTVLTALIGVYYFKEPATALKMVSIGLIVLGVMGLHSASRVSAG
jgi:small multidrug resistance pump